METQSLSIELVIILASELIALYLIWRIWRTEDYLLMKVALSLIALIPLFGPILVFWLCNFPDRAPRVLRDRFRYSTDVYDRWRHVLEEKNAVRRFRYWRDLMTRHRDEDP